MTSPRARGPYAKSTARRAEIIERASEAFSANGFNGASLREISSAVGLTQPGLIHHFGTKDALLAAVLEHKDVTSVASFDSEHVLTALRALVAQNLEKPGLIKLYTTLTAESINPSHPAHEYFTTRYTKARALFSGLMRRAQKSEEIAPDVDAETLGVLLVAVMDGLQLQWLHDQDVDVTTAFDAFLSLLQSKKGAQAPLVRQRASKAPANRPVKSATQR